MNDDAAPAPPPSGGFTIAGRRIDWGAREVGFGALWFLTLFLLLPVPLTLPFFMKYGEDAAETVGALLVGSYVSQLGLLAVAATFTFRKLGGGWDRLGFVPLRRRHLLWAGIGFAGALAVTLSYGGLVEVFDINSLKPDDCAEQVPDAVIGNPTLIVLTAILALGFAPLCEETFFRGFVMPGLAKSWGVVLGVIASAAFFTVGHSQPDDALATLRILLAIFPIGIIFALVYLRSGSILSTVIAHFCFNVLGTIGIAVCER
jgi:membrane protease YdiL (CAAX protease family)